MCQIYYRINRRGAEEEKYTADFILVRYTSNGQDAHPTKVEFLRLYLIYHETAVSHKIKRSLIRKWYNL